MASIVKTPSGKFKAIIRKNGRLLKTKTFSRKTDAKAWAARIEGDRQMLAAYGIGGASMPFRELAMNTMRNGMAVHVYDRNFTISEKS